MPRFLPCLRAWSTAATLVCALASAGCLVVSLHPVYDDESIAWDDGLVGTWRDAEDNIDVTIERAEWRSYAVRYKHPVDTGAFTAHLTIVGDTRYLDLMPERGKDYGALLVPVHAIVRVAREGDTMTVTPLDYDRLSSAFRHQPRRASDPAMAMDQKQNVFLTGSTGELRQWLRLQGGNVVGAPAAFTRNR